VPPARHLNPDVGHIERHQFMKRGLAIAGAGIVVLVLLLILAPYPQKRGLRSQVLERHNALHEALLKTDEAAVAALVHRQHLRHYDGKPMMEGAKEDFYRVNEGDVIYFDVGHRNLDGAEKELAVFAIHKPFTKKVTNLIDGSESVQTFPVRAYGYILENGEWLFYLTVALRDDEGGKLSADDFRQHFFSE